MCVRSFVCVIVVVIQGERHARRFVEMWMGQSLQNAWRGWCAVLQGARLRRLRVTRFMAIRRLRTLSRMLRGLTDNVIERRLIARVRARWTNVCLWKVCDDAAFFDRWDPVGEGICRSSVARQPATRNL